MKKTAAIFFILLFFQFPIFAQTAFPRLSPDPKALEYYRLGQRNNGYTWRELAEISLWASGDTNASGLPRIIAAVETLNSARDLPRGEREKAEYILTFLHRNFLRSYSLYQTRVDTIFSNGRYNCVSSAVLYIILCKSAGLEASGVITRDHAFAMVHINGENIDVETTNAYGFDPGNRREFHDDFGRLTGFTYVPAQNYRDRQTITPIMLISVIFNNRIAEHERRNRFADAVPLAVDRAALLTGSLDNLSVPSSNDSIFKDPHNDLMDRIFNYGATLLNNGRETDVLRWLELASPLLNDEERWQELIMAAVTNNLARLTRTAGLTEARSFLESNKDLLSVENYLDLDRILIDGMILRDINQIQNERDGELLIILINRVRETGNISERRAAELLSLTIQKTAIVIADGRNWREALSYIENAITRFGSNRDLELAANQYRTNLVTDYHNRFASEWNRRNFDEAERILNEGLAEFPNDRRLLRDRETVERYRRN